MLLTIGLDQQHAPSGFRLTRDLIQSVIADMDLDPDSLSQVNEAFISV